MNLHDRPVVDPARLEALHGLLFSVQQQQARVGAELSAMLATLADARGISASGQRPGWLPGGVEVAAVGRRFAALSEIPSGLPGVGPTVVRCLGGLDVEISGVPIASWRSGKARSVFEYLVTHRRRPVPRDTLIQALWPDPDALASGTSLKVAVHALRQIFPGASRGGPPPTVAVVVQESSYQLQARDLWLDVDDFERCCALGAKLEARGEYQDALVAYECATELYRGDFLPESWDEWAIFRREGLKDQYLGALSKLADARLQAREYQACITLCRQLLEQDCCREDTFRMLMLCHAHLGQRGRVRRWFELCEMSLRSSLDTVPEAETVRIFEWACGGSSARVPERSPDATARLTAR